jgi:hypothetical protein
VRIAPSLLLFLSSFKKKRDVFSYSKLGKRKDEGHEED